MSQTLISIMLTMMSTFRIADSEIGEKKTPDENE